MAAHLARAKQELRLVASMCSHYQRVLRQKLTEAEEENAKIKMNEEDLKARFEVLQ